MLGCRLRRQPPDVVDGLEQGLCHPHPEMYAMFEGEECPPTARDGVFGDGETVKRIRAHES